MRLPAFGAEPTVFSQKDADYIVVSFEALDAYKI